MRKTEQLLEMLEHPERYSESQWQEILADDECRELYTLMSKPSGKDCRRHLTKRLR